MKPERRSKQLLGITQSKAKMYEYAVALEHHIAIPRDPATLFSLTIGMLGDLATSTIPLEFKPENAIHDAKFAARFFDTYRQTQLNSELSPYLALIGAATYYLCDLPGSSDVLIRMLENDALDLQGMGLERLLYWLLRGSFSLPVNDGEDIYKEQTTLVSSALLRYFNTGEDVEMLMAATQILRRTAYAHGTPRQLLFADLVSAIVKKRVYNSTWRSLPEYSSLSKENWRLAIQKTSFLRELWPAQHLMGQQGAFRGVSAVVQMPTSAGKTRAVEILLRSAFISGRASLAVIVAPFRALCNEIRQALTAAFAHEMVRVDEFSDVPQVDFDIGISDEGQRVLVTTPEKLVYVLRNNPELSTQIGLLVFDEGHQFDNGLRGVTYELLLTSLKSLVPMNVQKVLVSAVMSNASIVSNWLNGDGGSVISGKDLTPTYRSIAFASWKDLLGRLEFMSEDNPNQEEFFVPRVIEQQELQLRKTERKRRVFPERDDGGTVAMYLGLKLVRNGGVAVFCGRKDSAVALSESLIDAFARGLRLEKPVEYSSGQEIEKLYHLHLKNLGADATSTKCASFGVFSHHGNTPHGIRLAVEYAVKHGLAKFVVCTSTLAQGVNLPIRYLIVTTFHQGLDRIKVRDFQNLIGRAGRSGMHTEGSIIFADPKVYDKRTNYLEKWRWDLSTELLNFDRAEPCSSSLLSIFQDFQDDSRRYPLELDLLEFVKVYVKGKASVEAWRAEALDLYSAMGVTGNGLDAQINWKIGIIGAIESYLLAQWDVSQSSLNIESAANLALGTLAYYQADQTQKAQLIELFRLLAQNIEQRIADPIRRRAYGKMLLGVLDVMQIEKWVQENVEQLLGTSDQEQLLKILWPIILQNTHSKVVQQAEPKEPLLSLALSWINGVPFHQLHIDLLNAGVKITTPKQRRQIKLEQMVEVCENGFGYDSTQIVGAITEMVNLLDRPGSDESINALEELQKRLRYGLPSMQTINLYELGFADRVISLEMSGLLPNTVVGKTFIREEITRNLSQFTNVLALYPSYYSQVLEQLT